MSARTVREDQHGTTTGYVYGCRCDDCRAARREYARENPHEWCVSTEQGRVKVIGRVGRGGILEVHLDGAA